MFVQSLKTVLIVVAISQTCSWNMNKKSGFESKALQRKLAQTLLAPLLFVNFNPLFAPLPSNAIPALDAATSAMFEKNEKVVKERDVSSLPPAAKKRKALAMCKESDVPKRAGYLTSAGCTSDVLEGNYERILSGERLSSSSSSSSSAKKLSSETTTKSSSSSSKSTEAAAPSRRAEKVADLSSLPPAAKKRRALAACKKSDIRKSAKMGSESKCTERVLQGDVESLIEALEYGG